MAITKKATGGYQARITLEKLFAYVPIAGANLEEALENAKKLDLSDVLSLDMKDVIDGEVVVQGVDER